MSNSIMLPIEAFANHEGLSNDPEVKRLRFCHELWLEYSPRWEFYLSAYNGGEDFATQANLFKHARETASDFDERVKRLDNMNYCEPLVAFFTNFIFAESIDRGGGSNSDFYKEFSQDVSLRGETVDDFFRQVSDDSQIYGMVYVLADAPPLVESEGEVLSKQSAKDQNIRPYWVLIPPIEITDWTTDAFGNLSYAKRKQHETSVEEGERRCYEVYTEFFPDRYVISRIDTTEESHPKLLQPIEFPNRLGRVPMEVARYKRSKKYPHIGLSFLCDFAYNNRRVLNITSMLDEFLYRQCFNILARETSGIPLAEEEEGTLGTSNIMEHPHGTKVPSYITPPIDPAQILQDERARIITQMYLRANQEAFGEMANGEKSSGFSQSQSFSKTVPFISSRADMLERVESSLMKTTMEMMGETWDGKIKYKDRYELTNLTSALTQLLMLVKDLQIGSASETFVKTQLIRLVHEYDGKLSIEDQTEIEKQIEAMDFKAWAATQKLALLGPPKTSPGAQQKPKKDSSAPSSDGQPNVSSTAKLRN